MCRSGDLLHIQGSFITLNLNGHTKSTIPPAIFTLMCDCRDKLLGPGTFKRKANGNPCAGKFHNLMVFGGTPPRETHGCHYAHVIRLGQNMSGGPTIDDTTFNFHFILAKGINIQFSSNATGLGPTIHDNIFNDGVIELRTAMNRTERSFHSRSWKKRYLDKPGLQQYPHRRPA